MKKATYLLLCLSGITFVANGSGYSDSLHFFTKHEEIFYNEVIAGNSSQLFNLYMSIDSSYSRKSMALDSNYFFNHVQKVKTIEKPAKKYNKYLKTVYETLHQQFLKKYTLENSFSNIFTKGEYNCVSGVMLYGLVLQELQVPFEIKETPTHVYLVAKPGNEQILIETTDPVNGFNNITTGFKQHFINQLVDSKLIGAHEHTGSNTNELFDEYYFKAKTVDLSQLAAIQYTNSGIYLLEKKEYLKAFWQFQKSAALYPNEKTEALLYVAGASYIAESDYTSLVPVGVLVSLVKLPNNKPGKKEVEGEFSRITNEMLNNRYDVRMYDRAYELVKNAIEDEGLRLSIDFLYNYERGRLLILKRQFKNALPFMENAYSFRSSNIETENVFVSCLAASFESEVHFSGAVEAYWQKYPGLQKNNHFANILLSSYLLEMHDFYSTGKANDGNFYKLKFENLMDEKNPEFREHDLLGSAYSKAAVYHFKRGETSRAKTILNKGLSYSPNNYELKTRLMMINR